MITRVQNTAPSCKTHASEIRFGMKIYKPDAENLMGAAKKGLITPVGFNFIKRATEALPDNFILFFHAKKDVTELQILNTDTMHQRIVNSVYSKSSEPGLKKAIGKVLDRSKNIENLGNIINYFNMPNKETIIEKLNSPVTETIGKYQITAGLETILKEKTITEQQIRGSVSRPHKALSILNSDF